MKKKQGIDVVQKDCNKIAKSHSKYYIETLAHLHEKYLEKEVLRKSPYKYEKRHQEINQEIEKLLVGFQKKTNDLKSSYISNLKLLVDLKRQLLKAKDQAVISIMDPLTQGIRDLRLKIKQLEGKKDESKNNKG
jgi:hypothetical protein